MNRYRAGRVYSDDETVRRLLFLLVLFSVRAFYLFLFLCAFLGYEEARKAVATYVSVSGATVEAKVCPMPKMNEPTLKDFV